MLFIKSVWWCGFAPGNEVLSQHCGLFRVARHSWAKKSGGCYCDGALVRKIRNLVRGAEGAGEAATECTHEIQKEAVVKRNNIYGGVRFRLEDYIKL